LEKIFIFRGKIGLTVEKSIIEYYEKVACKRNLYLLAGFKIKLLKSRRV